VPIPTVKRGVRWLLEQPGAYDLGLAFFTGVVGLSSAIAQYSQGHHRLAAVLAAATVSALIVGFAKSTVTLVLARRKESTQDLEGCLYTLHSLLTPEWDDGNVRLAIHVPVGGNELEQVTDYIGAPPKKGRVGRRFPANAGIIGKAYQENDAFVAQRLSEDPQAYVRELIDDWAYPPDLARRLNPAIFAWMAVPFNDPVRQQVQGILYVDSTDRDFFTDARQEVILQASAGIARFVVRRYTA
jgi:hypothetical protein